MCEQAGLQGGDLIEQRSRKIRGPVSTHPATLPPSSAEEAVVVSARYSSKGELVVHPERRGHILAGAETLFLWSADFGIREFSEDIALLSEHFDGRVWRLMLRKPSAAVRWPDRRPWS